MQTGGRNGLLNAQDKLQSQLERLQEEPNAIAEEGQRDGNGGHDGVEPEMVGGCHDDEKDERRVGDGYYSVESSSQSGEARLAAGFA